MPAQINAIDFLNLPALRAQHAAEHAARHDANCRMRAASAELQTWLVRIDADALHRAAPLPSVVRRCMTEGFTL